MDAERVNKRLEDLEKNIEIQRRSLLRLRESINALNKELAVRRKSTNKKKRAKSTG